MRNAILCVLLTSAAASASTFEFSQYGYGSMDASPLTGFFQSDPGPGGLVLALTYVLPFAAVQGDVILTDPNFSDLPMQILRFNGDGTVIFYAGNRPDSLAFVASPPSALYDNVAIVSDVGPEDSNFAMYTPSDGQPGFDTSNPTYIFFNGANSVPEPGTMALAGAALLLLPLRLVIRRAEGRT